MDETVTAMGLKTEVSPQATLVKRSINKVAFIDQVAEANMRIADDDVDSVQQMDISVIGDNLHDDHHSRSAILDRIKADTERQNIRIDEFDF